MANITKIEAGDHVREMYTPYAMSTIVDRALPDVRDGLKPVHRRILYSMWKSGIVYNIDRSKTTEPISETMKIHHHGDNSILEAIALMTEQNESLLHPFIDGEGAFGKIYSKDSPSAPRYTFCRLNKFAEEFFKDVKENVISMIGEDKTHLQPVVLSSDFPNILVKNNEGIATGEACKFPSFNLGEVCDATMEYINNKDVDLLNYLHGFDFSTGGYLIYDKQALNQIYNTGKGSIVLRAKYTYDKEDNCIDIYEIPYTTTVDSIIDKIKELMKNDNLIKTSISDVRDETGFNKKTNKEEMKITIDIKKNTNVEILMKNLFKKTSLESTFSANMNCLVDYEPKVLGVKQILDEWLKFRKACIKKSLENKIYNKNNELHLLVGLKKVLLDIDKAIYIIRNSKTDDLILNNLMENFQIDKQQSEHIMNIKLRNINKDNIINKIKNIENLENEVSNYKKIIDSEQLIDELIINQLKEIKKKYNKPRKTEILYEDNLQSISHDQFVEEFNPTIILTSQQYLKKNRKYSASQKLKDDDTILQTHQCNNKDDLLLFTNQGRVLTRKVYELEECQPSSYGTFIPNLLGEYLQENEKIIYISTTKDYKGDLITVYDNGNIARTDLSAFKTKTNRQVGMDAYNKEQNLIGISVITKDIDVLLLSDNGRVLIVNTKDFNSKQSRNTQGNIAMRLGEEQRAISCIIDTNEDTHFTLQTEKGKEKVFLLNDIAPTGKPNEERTLYKYLQGRKGNKGNHIYYNKTDKVVKLIQEI